MLHAKTEIQLHDKINSRGDKEQFAAHYGYVTIWGNAVPPSIKRKGCQCLTGKGVYKHLDFIGFYAQAF